MSIAALRRRSGTTSAGGATLAGGIKPADPLRRLASYQWLLPPYDLSGVGNLEGFGLPDRITETLNTVLLEHFSASARSSIASWSAGFLQVDHCGSFFRNVFHFAQMDFPVL